jgi:hypothetical protein
MAWTTSLVGHVLGRAGEAGVAPVHQDGAVLFDIAAQRLEQLRSVAFRARKSIAVPPSLLLGIVQAPWAAFPRPCAPPCSPPSSREARANPGPGAGNTCAGRSDQPWRASPRLLNLTRSDRNFPRSHPRPGRWGVRMCSLQNGTARNQPAAPGQTDCFAWIKRLQTPCRVYATVNSSGSRHRGPQRSRGIGVAQGVAGRACLFGVRCCLAAEGRHPLDSHGHPDYSQFTVA